MGNLKEIERISAELKEFDGGDVTELISLTEQARAVVSMMNAYVDGLVHASNEEIATLTDGCNATVAIINILHNKCFAILDKTVSYGKTLESLI